LSKHAAYRENPAINSPVYREVAAKLIQDKEIHFIFEDEHQKRYLNSPSSMPVPTTPSHGRSTVMSYKPITLTSH